MHSQAFNVHMVREGKFSTRIVMLIVNLHSSINKIFKQTLQFDSNWNAFALRVERSEKIHGCYHSMQSKLSITKKIAEFSFHLLIFYFLAKIDISFNDCSKQFRFCQREKSMKGFKSARRFYFDCFFSHTS